MSPRNSVPEDRDKDRSDRPGDAARSVRRTRAGGEGTYEERVERPDCPVCGRPCED